MIGIVSISFELISCADGTVDAPTNSREMMKLEKTKQELEEDNQTLRLKAESLMEMLAEVTAEHELRRTG